MTNRKWKQSWVFFQASFKFPIELSDRFLEGFQYFPFNKTKPSINPVCDILCSRTQNPPNINLLLQPCNTWEIAVFLFIHYFLQ